MTYSLTEVWENPGQQSHLRSHTQFGCYETIFKAKNTNIKWEPSLEITMILLLLTAVPIRPGYEMLLQVYLLLGFGADTCRRKRSKLKKIFNTIQWRSNGALRKTESRQSLLVVTRWRNGSASDSRSEGCEFKSRPGHFLFFFSPTSTLQRIEFRWAFAALSPWKHTFFYDLFDSCRHNYLFNYL